MKIHLAYVLFQGASLYILDFYAFCIYFHKTISMNKFFLRGSIIFSGLLQLLLHIWDVFTLGTVEFCSRMRKVLFYWHGSFITCLFSFLCFFVIYVSVMIVNSLTVSRLVVLQEPFQFFFQLLTTLFNIYSMYACFLFKKDTYSMYFWRMDQLSQIHQWRMDQFILLLFPFFYIRSFSVLHITSKS